MSVTLEVSQHVHLHYIFPFYIVLLLILIAYAGGHPYIKNYCKGRLWVAIVLKVSFGLFWIYNLLEWADWFGAPFLTSRWGLWELIFGNRTDRPIYGNVFLTSFSGLLTMFLPIILIFDKKMTVSRFLFPIGLLGGIVASAPWVADSTHNSIWYYVFIYNMGSVTRHMWLVLVCFIGILNTPKYKKRNDWWIYLTGVAVCYLYGLIIGFAIIPADSRYTVFGIFPTDYGSGGAYEAAGGVIPIYPLNMILMTALTVVSPIGAAALKEVCCQKIPYYRDVPPIFKKTRSIKRKNRRP